MATLADLQRSITALVDQKSVDEIKHVAGQAAKKAAIDVAERDLGSDAAFSGCAWRWLSGTRELSATVVSSGCTG